MLCTRGGVKGVFLVHGAFHRLVEEEASMLTDLASRMWWPLGADQWGPERWKKHPKRN